MSICEATCRKLMVSSLELIQQFHTYGIRGNCNFTEFLLFRKIDEVYEPFVMRLSQHMKKGKELLFKNKNQDLQFLCQE